MKPKKPKARKLWKTLGVTFLVSVLLLLLAVVAFVFNPLEGTLRDVRDAVPREVDFFLRKQALTADLADDNGKFQLAADELPKPGFWSRLTQTEGWNDLQKGPLVAGMTAKYEPVLKQVRDAMLQVQRDSSGFVDLGRDLASTEIAVSGYFEDKTKQPNQPLQEPWWCLYTRVTWRIRAAWGLASWSLVQNQLRSQGVDIQAEGDLLAVRLPGMPGQIYAARRLDCILIGNSKHLLEQSLRLIDGSEREQPFGQSARYLEGITQPVERWSSINSDNPPNALEFSVAPNAIDGFRRFSASWPDENNKDSMNERVFASFLKLAGWTSVTGAFLFEPERLSVLGEVVLNSHMHTKFQQSFYKAEKQARSEWLDPFLRMVPQDACAAAALRMPAGEFLRAMNGAMLPNEKSLLNDAARNCTFQKQPLADSAELIEKLSIAFLPRTGFVFRHNEPDKSINPDTGKQWIPDPLPSPVPQIAWIFWLRPGQKVVADEFVDMLSRHAAVFRFDPVLHLKIDGLPDPVTEFVSSQIPGTGELAMIVFSDFFVMSNSGPLIKDILRTRYSSKGARSMVESESYQRIERELPKELNGFVWMNGQNLIPALDKYRSTSEALASEPDPGWMMENRPVAEREVQRERYPQYPSLAGMPPNIRNGEFAEYVTQRLNQMWAKAGASLTAGDLANVDQLKAMAKLIDAAYLRLDLENNYIRFQGKVLTRF